MQEWERSLGIVVVTYQTPICLEICLLSIRRCVQTYDLIVVDNGSDSESANVVSRAKNVYKYLSFQNIGFCKAVNQAVKNLKSVYLAIVPADCIITPFWKEHMIKALVELPKAGIVGPMCTQTSGLQGVEGTGLHEQNFECSRIVFNGAVMKTDVFRSLGGLDEGFPNKGGNFCDDDLSRRYVIAGYKNYVVGHLIFHTTSASYLGNVDNYGKDLELGRAHYNTKWFGK
ncbi:hypothetical protein ES702_07586 [subsurface metagenome]